MGKKTPKREIPDPARLKKPRTRINVTQTYEYWNTEEKRGILTQWVRNGYTNTEIAKLMGIALSTLYEWFKRSSELKEAFNTSKEQAIASVEQALIKKALGFTRLYTDRYGEVREIEEVPDTKAIMFYLNNLAYQRYKDKQVKVEVNTNHDGDKAVLDALKAVPVALDEAEDKDDDK